MSAEPASPAAETRVPITLARGLVVALVYFVVVVAAQLISGVDFDKLSESTSNVFEFVVVPVGLAIFAVLALTARWGWWQPVFIERDRLTAPRWLWLIPAFITAQIAANLVTAPWGDWDAGLVLTVLLGTLMVGFGEELVFRGYLLVGARERYSEKGAWFLTSALFGVIHGVNLINGQAIGPTIKQMFGAFILGGAFYFIRRLTGLLIVGMVLHGLWDFSTFIKAGPGEAAGATQHLSRLDKISGLPASLAMATTAIAIIVLFRRRRAKPAAAATTPV